MNKQKAAASVVDVIEAAEKDPRVASALCDAIAQSKALGQRMRATLRAIAVGKSPGRVSDEIDKLATFMAYSELSLRLYVHRTGAPLIKKGYQLGHGGVAELLAHVQGISINRFNNKNLEGKKLYKKFPEMPYEKLAPILQAAAARADLFVEQAIATVERSRNSAKTRMT